jgi:hypothetical protein
MPYKVVNSAVMVQKGGKWVLLKKHESHEKALAHLRALYANVKDAK